MSPELLADYSLGQEAEAFYKSDLGQYVLGRIDEEILDSQYQLGRVSPWRRRRIQQLQNQLHRAESFKSWMAELIMSGRQALDQLQIEE